MTAKLFDAEMRRRGFEKYPVDKSKRTVGYPDTSRHWRYSSAGSINKFMELRYLPVARKWEVYCGAELVGIREKIIGAMQQIALGFSPVEELMSTDNFVCLNYCPVRYIPGFMAGGGFEIPANSTDISQAIEPVFKNVWEPFYMRLHDEETVLKYLLIDESPFHLRTQIFVRIAQIAYLAVRTEFDLKICDAVVQRNLKFLKSDSYGSKCAPTVFRDFCERFQAHEQA